MIENTDLTSKELNALLDIFSGVDSLREVFFPDEFCEGLEILNKLARKEYLAIEKSRTCTICGSMLFSSQKFCKICLKPTEIKEKIGYYLTEKFSLHLKSKIQSFLYKHGWREEFNNLYSKNFEKCYFFQTQHNFEDSHYFSELGKAFYHKAHRIILIVPRVSPEIKKFYKYSDYQTLLLEAETLKHTNLEQSLSDFLKESVNLQVLRDNALRKFIEKGNSANQIIAKIMEEKQYHQLSDLFIWGCVQDEALVKSSTRQKVGYDFQDIVGAFFSIYINPKTFVLGSSGEPDIVSHFIDQTDEICYISCKATSKEFYKLSKKDIDEINDEIETIKHIKELENKLTLVIFITSKFDVSQLEYYGNYIEEKRLGVKVTFISIQSFISLISIARKYRAVIDPYDFLTFFKRTRNCNDKMIEERLEKILRNRKNNLKTQIRTKTSERREIRKWNN